MKKILFSDMDGTIIENNQPISQKDIEAIHRLREAGYYFAFCTGRNLQEVEVVAHHFEYDFMVLNNGAMVVDQNNQVVHNHLIANEDGKDILNYCLKTYPHLVYSFYTGKETIIYQDGKTCIYTEAGFEPTDQYDFIKDYQAETDDFQILCAFNPNGSIEEVKEIQNYLENQYDDVRGTLNVIYLDITHANCTKGTGLQTICQDLKDVESYCIGDSYNDISMFQVADHPYTFNRVENEVKQYTQKQVDYVYEVIEDMLK